MPDPNRMRNVVSAPAYILARPAAARPPRISPTRKTVRNRKGSDGRSSTNAKAREASTPLSRLTATRLRAERTLGCEVKLKQHGGDGDRKDERQGERAVGQ